jgi:hypothetical protein
MFASFSGVEAGSQGSDTFSLMRQMREEGLQLKRSAVNTLDGEPVENVVVSSTCSVFILKLNFLFISIN